MSDFINTIDQLGDDVVLASIIDGSITEFKDNTITYVAENTFENCSNLTMVDLPNVTSVGREAFNGCSSLNVFILRSETICEGDYGMLDNTPITQGTGYIYFPSSLIDTYKNRGYWNAFKDQFRALEDYTVDGTIMGDLDETKI
jgi:hypothetical protein